jgi:hypothetical protein
MMLYVVTIVQCRRDHHAPVGTATQTIGSLVVPAILSVTSLITYSDGNDTISTNDGPDLIIGGLGFDSIQGKPH